MSTVLWSVLQVDQAHQQADGQGGEAVHQDPADAPGDAGQEGELPRGGEDFSRGSLYWSDCL